MADELLWESLLGAKTKLALTKGEYEGKPTLRLDTMYRKGDNQEWLHSAKGVNLPLDKLPLESLAEAISDYAEAIKAPKQTLSKGHKMGKKVGEGKKAIKFRTDGRGLK